MRLQNNTVVLAAIYVALIAVSGVAAGTTSASAWVSLGALALLPACSMLIIWGHPLQTRSAAPEMARR